MILAPIISFEEFERLRSEDSSKKGKLLGKIVCTSGGFDPIHPGHISCLYQSKKYGDTLVVIVNGDNFLKTKKGRSFMDLETRCHIVSYIKGVDYVIPFEIENDQTVSVALSRIKPHIFTKGGDRIDASTIPEWKTCEKYNIKVISGIGLDKKWSSSDFLRDWVNFFKNK